MKVANKQVANPKGFTLIEIAIVLVIIGLLIGGVLKGQQLIENSKVKNAANDMNGVIAAYNGYLDQYKRLPGDDGPIGTLTGRGGNWLTVTEAGNSNGVIASTAANAFTGGGECAGFWQHLKAAGFLTGNPADAGVAALPRNAFGGLIGITNATVMNNMIGNKVCLSQVPGKAAAALDVQLDDSLPNTGSIQATLGVVGQNTAPGAAAAGYDEGLVYTICRSM